MSLSAGVVPGSYRGPTLQQERDDNLNSYNASLKKRYRRGGLAGMDR